MDADSILSTYILGVIVLLSLSLYAVLELNFIILATFKTRRGLYFWSFVVATNGIALYSIGLLFWHIVFIGEPTKFVPLIAIGSVSMVTGQSLVLYSRLHLVLHNQFCLRLVLVLIITTAFTLHVPNIVLIFYSQAEPGRKPNMMWPWILYENFQATGFCVQELIISALYIKNLLSFFPLQEYMYDHKIRKIRHHLLSVNIMLILLDVLALLVGYFALHIYEKSGLYWKFDVFYSIGAAFRAVVYSVKLKVEFSILNSLVDLTHHSTSSRINLSQGDSRKDTCPGVPLDNIDCRTQNQAPHPSSSRSSIHEPTQRVCFSPASDKNFNATNANCERLR